MNFVRSGKTRGKFSQSEVLKISVNGRLLQKLKIFLDGTMRRIIELCLKNLRSPDSQMPYLQEYAT